MPAFDSYALVPATTAATVVVKKSGGRLRQVLVTSTGTGSGTFLTIYDNASAATGNVLFAIPSNAAAGTIYSIQVPAELGIVVSQVLNGPALTVSYD